MMTMSDECHSPNATMVDWCIRMSNRAVQAPCVWCPPWNQCWQMCPTIYSCSLLIPFHFPMFRFFLSYPIPWIFCCIVQRRRRRRKLVLFPRRQFARLVGTFPTSLASVAWVKQYDSTRLMSSIPPLPPINGEWWLTAWSHLATTSSSWFASLHW